ncbi:MAG: hypothetical protein WD598_17930 [Acidimicrobiia bacterium]
MTTEAKPLPAPLWGVGSFRVGDQMPAYAVSQDDHGRDISTAMKAVASLGLQKKKRALVLSMLSEAAQYWPVQIALLVSKAQFSLADASRFDAFRTAMFLRAMQYDVVLGINTDVLDGLDDLGHAYADIFAKVPVLSARAGAYERLRDAGLSPRWWLHVGPTVAVECDQLQGAHVDGDEWELDSERGEVLISARKPRAATIDRLHTAVQGEIVTEVCACGRSDPRVIPQ